MSCNRYTLIQEKNRIIHSDARLLYLSTAKYGGDWHSLPHTHDFTELFLSLEGADSFPLKMNFILCMWEIYSSLILMWNIRRPA